MVHVVGIFRREVYFSIFKMETSHFVKWRGIPSDFLVSRREPSIGDPTPWSETSVRCFDRLKGNQEIGINPLTLANNY